MDEAVVFTHHALERGVQIGLNEWQLRSILVRAKRLTPQEIEDRKLRRGGNVRFYRSGSTVFTCGISNGKRIVITVFDDMITRNEGYRLKYESTAPHS